MIRVSDRHRAGADLSPIVDAVFTVAHFSGDRWLVNGRAVVGVSSRSLGKSTGARVAQNIPGLGGAEMLQRLGDTTGRNWTMAWPGGGSGVEWLNLLGAALLVLTVLALVFRRARLGRWLFWISALTIVVLAVIIMWRLINWQSEIELRPDDLLTTFPVVLLLFLLLPYSFARRSAEVASSSRQIVKFLLTVATSFLVLVLLASPFQGGVQWGPRLLLPVIVPLSVALVDTVAQLWTPLGRVQRVGLAAVLGVLLAVGGYSTYLGAQFIRGGQNGNAEFQQAINASPERVVVTDAWFISQGAPYTFENKSVVNGRR